ncbi:MAG: ATP-grasp domain-containing protein [Deltaproteobacteria bacterium]|nr:ATP-grasp domain-containing protein [Deltaproteobacteria bacterium]
MKIAFTHNLRLTDSEEEAEFDSAETVEAVAAALVTAGHEVEKIEVSGPASHLAARIEACAPDLIFNTAEGRRGRAREAFYPAFFEELGFPYTGSDAYVLTVTLDKWLTKEVLRAHGIDSPRGRLVTPAEYRQQGEAASLGLAFPVIVKPNYEGSSKGIGEDAVARDGKQLLKILDRALEAYPLGMLCEEFIPGTDISVPFLEGCGDEGLLLPVEFVVDPAARSRLNIYEYRLKHAESAQVQARCPADLPRDVTARVRALAKTVMRTLGVRDLGRVEFRLGEDGRIFLLEVNALPSLQPDNDIFAAAAREGLSYDETIAPVTRAAALRWGLEAPRRVVKKRADKLRVGFTFNMKRVDTKGGDDAEAEYDSPATIDAIAEALESLGHSVIRLEANADLPSDLPEADIDLVFNIAEGLTGRNREAAVPALCELLGIPYTGSDSATLAIALDKALTKKVLKQHGILTPEFQLFMTGREKISPALRYPCIVKPNAEGSSKGIASTSVVDDEAGLRNAVRDCVGRYKQPALVEEYITGREFTVGLLGDRRPRVLPPMEVVFKDQGNARPVYDFTIKQHWEKYVEYRCPAPLTPTELKTLERAARETFLALDCRDVARVDLRMNADGEAYVIEINPLPGLTPGYSDLVLIARAAGIDFRTLIAEILAGGVKRLREKRQKGRQEREAPGNGGRRAEGGNGGNGGSTGAGAPGPVVVAPDGEL